MPNAVLQRWRRRGFVGPRYAGWLGKLRLLLQHTLYRTDVVLVAEPSDPLLSVAAGERLALRRIQTWNAFTPFASELDAGFHPGYGKAWQAVFGWGETLVVALQGERLAGFGWLQTGTRDGVPCPYGRVFEGEYRILRVGVLPAFRRQAINTRFYAQLLEELFAAGAKRVYIDCTKDNLPSLRAQIRAGFRPVGELRVAGVLLGGSASWWQPLTLDPALRELGPGQPAQSTR
jgi:ribosomal protein S18 acetylase RimI-like enzyme